MKDAVELRQKIVHEINEIQAVGESFNPVFPEYDHITRKDALLVIVEAFKKYEAEQ